MPNFVVLMTIGVAFWGASLPHIPCKMGWSNSPCNIDVDWLNISIGYGLDVAVVNLLQVANIGPASYNYDETLTTLRYANRAKNIQNKPKINEDPKDALLREFQEEIAKLV